MKRPVKTVFTSMLQAASIAVLVTTSFVVCAQSLSLQTVVVGDPQPTGIHHAGDGSGRLFLVSKAGTLSVFDDAAILPQPFLDLTPIVRSTGVERGLHGLAFHPDYDVNGFFYVMYTDLNSDSTLARYKVSEDPNVADPASGEILLVIPQPDQFHNASQLQFGPDGFLYIGSGDGGFVGDPNNNAQNLSTLLGKILRIDVDGGSPYAIPPDNPFVGVPGARPEIWAYGVRNPWRFSFDRLTGDLYMGDVGQSTWEEVNFQPASSPGGENYGWRLMEGLHCYNPPTGCFNPSLTLPILEYEHQGFLGQCSVTGGFVYRGSRFPRFEGAYFYGDWCSGRVWAARQIAGQWISTEVLDSSISPNTFGEDEAGELFVGDDNTGTIYKLIDPMPFCDIATSQDIYTVGETISASVARLVNLGETSPAVRLQIVLIPPSGGPVVLLDRGADGSFLLPSGTEIDRGPIDLDTVDPGVPLGTYSLNCRLSAPATGVTIAVDQAFFEVQ